MLTLAEFIEISKKFGDKAIIDNFSLSIPLGAKIALMGESGSGKTTLLRIAAGLLPADSGKFIHEGKIAFMFQEPRLLPWKSALENIRAILPKEDYSLAEKYLSLVGLSDAADKMPRELSGGMAQRVAYARFLAFAEAEDADLLLLDEPFSALDGETEEKMLTLLKDFSIGKTLMIVTHDEIHADALGAKIIKI